jgi:hypothetical protein
MENPIRLDVSNRFQDVLFACRFEADALTPEWMHDDDVIRVHFAHIVRPIPQVRKVRGLVATAMKPDVQRNRLAGVEMLRDHEPIRLHRTVDGRHETTHTESGLLEPRGLRQLIKALLRLLERPVRAWELLLEIPELVEP